jgi:phospho-N-acetylmuramoyl-pentapeptide-transferase
MIGEGGFSSTLPSLIGSVMPADNSENMAVSLAIGGLAFVVTLILGRPIVTFLRLKKLGDVIRADGPSTHIKKMGTPTSVLITAVFNLAGRLSMLLPIGILLAAASLGAVDDWIKISSETHPDRRGMTARFKFAWLVAFAVVAGSILHFPSPWGLGLHRIYFPFFGSYDIGIFHLPIAIPTR